MKSIPKPEPGGLDPDSIVDSFAHRMMYSVARDAFNATDLDAYQALAFCVRDRIMDRWFKTQDAYYRADVKRVYYLSLEFLLGRLLTNGIINLGAKDPYLDALMRLGFQLEALAEREPDAGLGNGGLGRLAACFLESASTLGLPFYGYGIRYEYGIFRQRIIDGKQVESPDNWLRYGNPWEVARPDVLFPVRFYGRTEYYTDASGRGRYRWVDTSDVYAMAYDIASPGYRNGIVNSLRLWAAKASREFDLAKFNAGAYVAAVEEKDISENISKVLYPPDDQYAGRELRLKQQHFFTSATIQDVIRRFKKRSQQWSELPDRVAVQLNDTHPAIAIPEMMRVLVDEELVEWEDAWAICQKIFAYTNHTVLPEALEAWPIDLFRRLLPRHWEIVQEVDRRFRALVVQPDVIARTSIIDDRASTIRMANLAIVGSHSVNGVAKLHTQILKDRVFRDFDRIFPGKLNNKTNGVTPRRWMLQANPELSALITETIGEDWPRDLGRLRELEQFTDTVEFRDRWRHAKFACKKRLSDWLRRCHSIEIDPEWLFDVQVKRIHEYKRQLLNVMHAIALYYRILDGDESTVPRCVIIAGKSAPSYAAAKMIIELVHAVGAMIRKEPAAARKLNVVFIPNYDVSTAEVVFPATDLSEQISTAGTEASGTGCMKAIMNGGVIIGTLDGANIEIRDEVGAANMFVFGHTAEQIASGQAGQPVLHDQERRVLDTITRLGFQPLVQRLTTNDPYFHLADFASYAATQRQAAHTWFHADEWTPMSVANVARSGRFSSDRTIAEYASEIWGVMGSER